MPPYINAVHALKRNERLFGLTVSCLDSAGRGVVKIKSRADNRVFSFTKERLLPGERVTLTVSKMDVTMVKGRRTPVKEYSFDCSVSSCPSPHEVPANCEAWLKGCRGCKLKNLEISKQWEEKLRIVKEGMEKFGLVEEVKAGQASVAPRLFARLRFCRTPSGPAVSFKDAASFTSVPIRHCPALSPGMNKVMDTLLQSLRNFQVFDERTGKGLLRELIIREHLGKVLIGIVVAPGSVYDTEALKSELVRLHETETGNLASVSFAVSNSDLPGIDDCGDPGLVFERVAGAEAVDGVRISSDGFHTATVFEEVKRVLKEEVFVEKVLIVNPPRDWPMLRLARAGDVVLNHVAEGEHVGEESSYSSFSGDLINQSGFDFCRIPSSISSVLLTGEVSSRLRDWIKGKPSISSVWYITPDLKKIVWDAEHLHGVFKMTKCTSIDDSPHNPRAYTIVKWERR